MVQIPQSFTFEIFFLLFLDLVSFNYLILLCFGLKLFVIWMRKENGWRSWLVMYLEFIYVMYTKQH